MPNQSNLTVVRTRALAEDVRADERARDVYVAATERQPVLDAVVTQRRHHWYRLRRTSDASRPLTAVAQDVIDLYNAGASEAELRRFELHVRETIDLLVAGAEPRELGAIDIDDAETDVAEDRRELRRHVVGATVEQLRAEAEDNRRQAAVSLEKARTLDLTARRREQRERLRPEAVGDAPRRVG